MRFLHIADLHIGKQLNDVSFLEDQRFILDQIADIAVSERADGVLIAGDVYQKSSPPPEAMTLFNDFVTRLVKDGLRVFMISGNHDSDQRIAYLSDLIRPSGVYANRRFSGEIQKIALEDEYGRLNICMLPFVRPAQVRRYCPEAKIATCGDAIRAVLDSNPADKRARNVLVCHQFVAGAERCDSEEMPVGGLDSIDGRLFDDYDYVALGHIHKPQRLLRDTMRYAGSPLKYSLSEAEHKKSVTVVDLLGKGDVRVKTLPLQPIRDMRAVEGTIDSVMRMPYSEDYVSVTVHDEIVPPDTKLDIHTQVFPNMLRFAVENSKTKYSADVLVRERVESRSVEELFIDFFRFQHNDVPPTEAQLEILNKARAELEEEQS